MLILVTPKNVRNLLESLGQITLPTMIKADELTDDQLDAIAGLFLPWKIGETVEVDWIREYAGKLYACIQAHTTQSDWQPPIVPALWVLKQAPGVIADWVQPGSENPYMIGDQVMFEGAVWESTINDNVWSPTSYPAGWEEVI